MPDFPLNGNFSWKRAWNQKKIPGSLNKTPAPVSFCGSSRRGEGTGVFSDVNSLTERTSGCLANQAAATQIQLHLFC